METPKIKKGIYQHYKNKKKYQVLDVVRHTETEEWMVLYKALYKSEFAKLCVRPYAMFFEEVKDPVTRESVPRFAPYKAPPKKAVQKPAQKKGKVVQKKK